MAVVFRLYVSGSHRWPRLRAAWGDVVEALTGASAPWLAQPRQRLGHAQHDDGSSVQVFSQPTARLEYQVVCRGGNPRDGWIHESVMAMVVQTPKGEVTLSMASVGGQRARPHEVWCSGPLDGAAFDDIRAALETSLGAGLPPSASCSVWAHNIRVIIDTEPDRARTWLAAALPARPKAGKSGVADLLELRDILHGTGEAHLRQRLRASPERLGPWLEARVHLPRGYTMRRVEAIIDRLQPYSPHAVEAPFDSPDPAGWRRLDLGAPSASEVPATVAVASTVLPELRLCMADEEWEPTEGGKLITRRTARFGRGGLPLAHVTRTLEVDGQARSRQAWVWGPGADDCLRIVNGWVRSQGTRRCAGSWLHLTGSPAFRQRAEAALLARCPHPLVPEVPDLRPVWVSQEA